MGLGPSKHSPKPAAGPDSPAAPGDPAPPAQQSRAGAFLAEELSKNPLLELRPATKKGEHRLPQKRRRSVWTTTKPTDDPGADHLILGHAEDDRPLDCRLEQSEALETDSFADVVTSSIGDEAFDFDRIQFRLLRLPSICTTSFMASLATLAPLRGSFPKHSMKPAICRPIESDRRTDGSAPRSCRTGARNCSGPRSTRCWRCSLADASRCRPRPPIDMIRRWRG